MLRIAVLILIWTVSLTPVQASPHRQDPSDPCGGLLTPRLTVGQQGQVTPGAPNNLRAEPLSSSARVGQIPGGDMFEVLEGPVCAEGIVWWRVRYNGQEGWTGESQDGTYWVEPYIPEAVGQSEAGWSVVLYEFADNGHLIEVGPERAERLSTPDCFSPPMNPGYHTWRQNIMAVSADRRLVAYAYPPRPGNEVQVMFANLETGNCFMTTVPNFFTVQDYAVLNLGVFSPDGSRFAFGYGDQQPDIGYIGIIVTVDLVESPGAVRDIFSVENDLPVMVDWTDEGIVFFPTCQGCEGQPSGLLNILDPDTGDIHETDEIFTQGLGDQLAGTGEVVSVHGSEDFAHSFMSSLWLNVMTYLSQSRQSAAIIEIYNDPARQDLPRPVWVQGGQAVLLVDGHTAWTPYSTPIAPSSQPTPATLIFRSGEVVDLTLPEGTAFLAGTTEGWLLFVDFNRSILHAAYSGGELNITDMGFQLNSQVVVVESTLWASTAQTNFIPMPDLDLYRSSACEILDTVSYLSSGAQGTVSGTSAPLYAEPNTVEEPVETFSRFTITAGPVCSDGSYWWLIRTDDGGVGWTPEVVEGEHLLRPDCPDKATIRPLEVGEQVEYDTDETIAADGVVYSKPLGKGEQVGDILDGDSYTILDGPVCDYEHYWWQVDVNGQQGWIIQPEASGVG